MGFTGGTPAEEAGRLQAELEAVFRPELLNRFQHIVRFLRLEDEVPSRRGPGASCCTDEKASSDAGWPWTLAKGDVLDLGDPPQVLGGKYGAGR